MIEIKLIHTIMKKFYYFILPVIVLFHMSGIASGGNKSSISVSGTISSNTTWTGVDTILVTGNVTISDGVTLTINPGMKVVFLGHYYINVQGRLLAIGTPADTIIFTVADTAGYHNHSHTGWRGIRIWDTPAGNDSTKLVYCRLEYGKDVDSQRGGAILVTGFKKLLVNHCELRYNYASLQGGAVFIWSDGGGRFVNSYFHHNYAEYDGGAILSWQTLVMENNVMTNNYSSGWGGAIYAFGGECSLINNAIYNNNADRGGGLYLGTCSNSIILNNTITGNSANQGGGIYNSNSTPVLKNSIVYGNIAIQGKQIYLFVNFCHINISYCDIEGGRNQVAGSSMIQSYENCLDVDPLFAGTGKHPYSIGNTSFCINAGDPATTTAQAGYFDAAGNPRIFDGYENIIDIGAYEFQGDPKPVVTSLFPATAGAFLFSNPSLSLIFSIPVVANGGTIKIYNANSILFEEFASTNTSIVTINGKTVSINPVNDFVAGESYYILIDDQAFCHAGGQCFSGFYENTDWRFDIESTSEVPGKALSFDGANDYVEIADMDFLDLTVAYTFEVWIRPQGFSSLAGILSKYQTNGAEGYFVRMLQTAPYTGINFDGMSTASGILSAGKWYHVAAVNDNGTRRLYLNGELQQLTGSVSPVVANSDPLRIGVDYSSRFFNGDIDEVRIWNVALTAAQVRENMHLALSGTEPGLLSYLQFNRDQGTVVKDPVSGIIGAMHNITGNYWIKAEMPFGKGVAASKEVSTTGNVAFTGTGFTADFTAKTGTDIITVSRIDTLANVNPLTVDTVYDAQYWVINQYGTGTFTANLSFTISEDLTPDDELYPANVRLYGRQAISAGDWSLVRPADAINAATNTAIFNHLSSFGQFVLGRHEGTAPLNILSFSPQDNGTMNSTDNLQIQFNEKAMEVAGKSIAMYRFDGLLIEEFILPSPNVTGTNTSIITIDPTNPLSLGEEFYVLVDSGAFENSFGTAFCGINDPETWNFSVLVQGHITTNAIWKDTVTVMGNVTLDAGVTLVIQPGTRIEFNSSTQFDINGTLLAVGTADKKIIFTKRSECDPWHNIRFCPTNPPVDTSRLIHCILEYAIGNPWPTQGGPVLVMGTNKLFISDCIFRYNGLKDVSIGALCCADTYFEIRNCIFHDNESIWGSAVFLNNAGLRITNCVMRDNIAGKSGGAMYIVNCHPVLTNTTIVNNSVDSQDAEDGGGIYLDTNSGLSTTNCILYGNKVKGSLNQLYIGQVGSNPDFYYCDIEGGKEAFSGPGAGENYTGHYEHNLNADPKFVGSGDFPCQLTISSPCYNGGDPASTFATAGYYDCAGDPRIQWGRIDIGAYELTIEADDFPGHALYFDGTTEYADLGNSAGLNLSDEITVEVWIKPDSINQNTFILKKGAIGLLHWDAQFETSAGQGIQINIPGIGVNWWEFRYNMICGRWYHVAWTRASDGTITAYINGQIVRKGHFPGTMTVNTDHLIIAAIDGSQRYKGMIDEVRISGVARTPEEIRENMYLSRPDYSFEFIAYWQFNEGSGNNIADVTGRYPGTLHFMDQTNWKNSTIPFGPGKSHAHIVSAPGVYDFSDADISISFSNISNTDTVVACRLDMAPNILPTNLPIVFDSSYWNINAYGHGNFKCDITFTIKGHLTIEDETFPHRIKLYTRKNTSDESWTLMTSASGVDAVNHKVTFSGINKSGQFIIAKDIIPDDFPGYAIEFDGVDDYFNLVNSDFTNIDTAFTIELWFKPLDMAEGFHTLARQGNSWEIRMFTDPSIVVIEFGINNNNLFSNFVTQPISFFNQWHHISCIYTNTGGNNQVKLYFNGVPAQFEVSEPINITSEIVVFGENFRGIVDEFRMWNSSRTQTEIRENTHLILPGLHANLISYLQFNEGSGTILYDVASDAEALLMNMDFSTCWVASSVPAGPGSSNTQEETYGMVDFPETGLTINYNWNGMASVTVTRIDTAPNILPEGMHKVFASQYWVVNRFGTGNFNADLTFKTDEYLSNYDVMHPGNIKLYARGSNSDLTWSLIKAAGSVDQVSNSVTFESIDAFSQFIICKEVRIPDRFPGTALAFDGMNDHVSGTGIPTSLNAITLEAWVYHNSLPAEVQRYITVDPEVAVIRFDGTSYGGYQALHFYIKRPNGNIWSLRADSVLATSEWMHVAGTYDGEYMKLYCNGELLKTLHQDMGMYQPNGNYGLGNGSLDGRLDEVRIWSTARTTQQIRENMHISLTGLEPGLLSYWQCNDGTGMVLKDIVSGNDGILVNMDPSNWIPSTIPCGGGFSDTELEVNGVVAFPATGLSMLFSEQAGAEVTVSRIDTLPYLNPMADTAFRLQYWVVNRYGTGSFTTDITFEVSEGLTAEQEANPTLVKLYTRASMADTNWALLKEASHVNAAAKKATFTGVSGFGQFIVGTDHPGYLVNLKAFLEGPFNGTGMDNNLSPDQLPGEQPYNISPWYYQGSESVASFPSDQVVDWVLVELRDTTQAMLAGSSTRIGIQAGFLLTNGSVIRADGLFPLKFHTSPTDSLYAVIWHRNHLGIISNFGLLENNGIYSYDFTAGEHQVLNGANAHKELTAGIWGMVSGDGNRDFEINNGDKIDVWAEQAGSNGYLEGDFNLDSHVNNGDKNDIWAPNTGLGGQVPD